MSKNFKSCTKEYHGREALAPLPSLKKASFSENLYLPRSVGKFHGFLLQQIDKIYDSFSACNWIISEIFFCDRLSTFAIFLSWHTDKILIFYRHRSANFANFIPWRIANFAISFRDRLANFTVFFLTTYWRNSHFFPSVQLKNIVSFHDRLTYFMLFYNDRLTKLKLAIFCCDRLMSYMIFSCDR